MIKITFTFLITCFLCIHGYSQDSEKVESFNTISIDSCISWMHSNFKNVDVYHEVALQTLKRAKSKETDSITAKVHEELSIWHAYNGLFSPDSAVYHTRKVLEFNQKRSNKKQIADTYELLSRHYVKARQLDKSQDVLFKAISIYEDINDEEGLGKAYRTLGDLYRAMEDFEKSVEYTYKAVPLLDKTENYGLLGMAYFNLIIGHGKLAEFEKAYQATEDCLKIVEEKVPEERFIPVKALS